MKSTLLAVFAAAWISFNAHAAIHYENCIDFADFLSVTIYGMESADDSQMNYSASVSTYYGDDETGITDYSDLDFTQNESVATFSSAPNAFSLSIDEDKPDPLRAGRVLGQLTFDGLEKAPVSCQGD